MPRRLRLENPVFLNKVKRLLREGKTYKEMYKLLKCSTRTITDAVRLIVSKEPEYAMYSKRLNAEIRRAKVKTLMNTHRIKDIANMMNVNIPVIRKDIKVITGDHFLRKDKINKRREQVEELTKNGKKAKEIADILKLDIDIVFNDLRFLLLSKLEYRLRESHSDKYITRIRFIYRYIRRYSMFPIIKFSRKFNVSLNTLKKDKKIIVRNYEDIKGLKIKNCYKERAKDKPNLETLEDILKYVVKDKFIVNHSDISCYVRQNFNTRTSREVITRRYEYFKRGKK